MGLRGFGRGLGCCCGGEVVEPDTGTSGQVGGSTCCPGGAPKIVLATPTGISGVVSADPRMPYDELYPCTGFCESLTTPVEFDLSVDTAFCQYDWCVNGMLTQDILRCAQYGVAAGVGFCTDGEQGITCGSYYNQAHYSLRFERPTGLAAPNTTKVTLFLTLTSEWFLAIPGDNGSLVQSSDKSLDCAWSALAPNCLFDYLTLTFDSANDAFWNGYPQVCEDAVMLSQICNLANTTWQLKWV